MIWPPRGAAQVCARAAELRGFGTSVSVIFGTHDNAAPGVREAVGVPSIRDTFLGVRRPPLTWVRPTASRPCRVCRRREGFAGADQVPRPADCCGPTHRRHMTTDCSRKRQISRERKPKPKAGPRTSSNLMRRDRVCAIGSTSCQRLKRAACSLGHSAMPPPSTPPAPRWPAAQAMGSPVAGTRLWPGEEPRRLHPG